MQRIAIALPLATLLTASTAGAQGARDREGPASSAIVEAVESARPEVTVTQAQLDELAGLQLEAIWDGLGDYKTNYVLGLTSTQPGRRIVGRALTMRFLPARPDLRRALQELAERGDWDPRYYGRAADEGGEGDVVVVDLGGASGDQLFGDVGALGMKLAGIRGAIIDGGSRDLAELGAEGFADFPVLARYFDLDTSKWLGAEWNAPVRIGGVTVLPGDIVVADEAGALFFPPEMLKPVLDSAREKMATEDFQREMLRSKKYRFRDVYPSLSPELQREYERRKREP